MIQYLDQIPSEAGFQFYGGRGDITWDNVTIVGFSRGIDMPHLGDNTVNGGWFDNAIDIYISSYGNGTTTLNVEASSFPAAGPVATMALRNRREPAGEHLHGLRLRQQWNMKNPSSDPTEPSPQPRGQTHYLYFRESARDYRLGDTSDSGQRVAAMFPASMADMTNGELWDRYHLALNGVVAPPDAQAMPGIIGLVSPTPPPQRPPETETGESLDHRPAHRIHAPG